jgi:hypothetical protein
MIHDTFNGIQPSLLLYQFIPIHPFIEYLQPEPEPPPLNSYFIYFILFIGHNKSDIFIFLLLSQQHKQFNRIPVTAPILGTDFRVLFTGMYLPQKSVLSPPIERQYKPFQKHVPSY